LGLGDLEAQRIPIPMLNTKLIFDKSSFQLVFIPKPWFNKIAALGSDFALPFPRYFPGIPIVINDDRTPPFAWDNVEYGARTTVLVSGLDLSAFVLSYRDRMPVYSPSFSGSLLTLNASHYRLLTFGATATDDLGDYLLRLEAIYTKDRHYDTLVAGQYANQVSDEVTGVLGIDFTRLEPLRLGVQVSEYRILNNFPGLLTAHSQELVSVLASGTPWSDHTAQGTFTYIPTDGSTLLELTYTVPINSKIELIAASDIFLGGLGSQFGQFHKASRMYGMLKVYLR
jgi:hypothetical protein